MRDPKNIHEVEEAGADWVGFIFFKKSPRYVAQKPAYLPERAKRVGVFVNASETEIESIADDFRLDFVQLHGKESPELCQAIRDKGHKVIKVFSLKSEADLSQTEAYNGCADFFLFDTPCKEYGGSGRCFDWSLLSGYCGTTPFILSGGLNPGSVDALKSFSHPLWAGIDLNSGFETAPAMKDAQALKEFIDKVKSEK